MSIREKDIPDDVFDAMREDWRWLADAKFTKGSLAYVLELAIEHGLVSPPCYALRKSENGELLTRFRVYTSREAANDCAPYRCKVEHWKGQVE